nr:hypothetical protein [uncultured bacterium]
MATRGALASAPSVDRNSRPCRSAMPSVRSHALRHTPVEAPRLGFAVTSQAAIHLYVEAAIQIESRIDLDRLNRAPTGESRSHQQTERESHLPDDKQIASRQTFAPRRTEGFARRYITAPRPSG